MRSYHRAAPAASCCPWAFAAPGFVCSGGIQARDVEERRLREEGAEGCCSSCVCRPVSIDAPGEEVPGSAGVYVETRDSNPRRQGEPDKVGLSFAAFALAHSGCGEEVSELRLDERTLTGWCLLCDDLRVFVIDKVPGRGERT